jgi:signal transduction histidine kinase
MSAHADLSASAPDPKLTPPAYSILAYLIALSYHSSDLSLYLTEIVRGVSQFLQADWTIATLFEGSSGQIVASSLDLRQGENSFSIHGTLAAEVVQSGRLLMVEDGRQGMRYHQLPKGYLGYLGLPLKISSGEVIGTLCSFFREPRSFTESEIEFVEILAERAATAIENFCLYQQQLQFNEQLIQEVTTCSTHLKRSQEKLIERERLAAIGEFTAMIVHEVRNPLTKIEMGLRYAQKALQTEAAQQRLALALSESDRLKHLLNEILCYAKPQVLQRSQLNIREFLDSLLLQIQELPEATERHISYVKCFPDIEIMADADKLKQVFLNILRNALEAIAPQEIVSCWMDQDVNANRVSIKIHNYGEPIPPEILPQIMTPFCSTKSTGTGLGLAISQRIIIAHGGNLEITSSSSEGTVVRPCIRLKLQFGQRSFIEIRD